MNIQKPVLTKEQVEALNRQKRVSAIGDIISSHAHPEYIDSGVWIGSSESLNRLSVEEIAIALIHGYEVEQTPEERLRELYNDHIDELERARAVSKYNEMKQHHYMTSGILKTLDTLNIKIEGINKEAE